MNETNFFDLFVKLLDILATWRFYAAFIPGCLLAAAAFLMFGLSTLGVVLGLTGVISGFLVGIIWEWTSDTRGLTFWSR